MLAKVHFFFAIVYTLIAVVLVTLLLTHTITLSKPTHFYFNNPNDLQPCPTNTPFNVLCAQLTTTPTPLQMVITILVPISFFLVGALNWYCGRKIKQKRRKNQIISLSIILFPLLLLLVLYYWGIRILVSSFVSLSGLPPFE